MLTLESSDHDRRLVAEQAEGTWSLRLEARDEGRWWPVAQVVEAEGWPIERNALRQWIGPTEAVLDGSALRLSGEGLLDGHRWAIADECAFAGSTLRLTRRWRHAADEAQDGLDLLIEVHCPTGASPQFLLPGISYNGNPNSAPGQVVPRFPSERPARCLYEEHRYPVPMVSCEWDGHPGRAAASLIVRPSRIGAEADDHWWTLGLALDGTRATMVVSSGTVETNGRRNAVYGGQGQLAEVAGWPVTAAPGQAFEKEVLLESGLAEPKGYGFRAGLWRAHALFRPATKPVLSQSKLIELKLNALRARYVEGGDVAGFLCVPKKNLYKRGPYFEWGWTGQSLVASWCALHEGRRLGKETLERMALRAADFFVGQPLPKLPDELIALRYDLTSNSWVYREIGGSEGVSSRQFGEAMTNLARLVELGRQLGLNVERWLERLCWGADFLCERNRWASGSCLPMGWTRDGEPLPGKPSAAGASCVSALALAGLLTGAGRYRVAARELLVDYHRAFLADLKHPPWGSTLDASCEDKEAALYLMAAALDCHDSFGEGRFLDWARQAADWALTFYYAWHPDFPPGKPCHGRLRAVGWPTVSVQNHHLDVFAMPSLFVRLGRAVDEPLYEHFARTMLQAATQSVAHKGSPWGFDRPEEHNVAGEQGEAVFHTNWHGRGEQAHWRGGHNTWNTLWVCVHPLREAILLREAGVTW